MKSSESFLQLNFSSLKGGKRVVKQVQVEEQPDSPDYLIRQKQQNLLEASQSVEPKIKIVEDIIEKGHCHSEVSNSWIGFEAYLD